MPFRCFEEFSTWYSKIRYNYLTNAITTQRSPVAQSVSALYDTVWFHYFCQVAAWVRIPVLSRCNYFLLPYLYYFLPFFPFSFLLVFFAFYSVLFMYFPFIYYLLFIFIFRILFFSLSFLSYSFRISFLSFLNVFILFYFRVCLFYFRFCRFIVYFSFSLDYLFRLVWFVLFCGHFLGSMTNFVNEILIAQKMQKKSVS